MKQLINMQPSMMLFLMFIKANFLDFKLKHVSNFKCSIKFCNDILENCYEGIHVGHHLSTLDKCHITNRANTPFWKSFNLFRADFGYLYPRLQCQLFNSYCCSFYGTPLLKF